MKMRRYELTDREWEIVKEYFPDKEPGTPGKPPKPARPKLNGVIWIAKSGAPWRDLPSRYGAWNTVYDFFRDLIDNGILVKIFADLNVDADLQDMSLDSTSVKVHQHGCGAKKGVILPK